MNEILYSQCWEDPLILSKAFNINVKDTIFSISSAGDNSLFLLSKSPKSVVSLDINPKQNFLLELKACAIKILSYDECLKFLGFLECDDRLRIYNIIRPSLKNKCRKYWDANIEFITCGVIHIGKLERYLGIFRKIILPISHSQKDINDLLSLHSTGEQIDFFNKRWNNFLWRSTFKIFFSKFFLRLIGRDKIFFRYNNKQNVATHYLEKTHLNLISIPIRHNYFLYYILKGTYNSEELPEYMKRENFYKIKSNINSLKIITCDLSVYLRSCKKQTFTKFNLSDVFEVYSQKDYEYLITEIARISKKNAIVCYWNNLVDRFEHKGKELIFLKKQSNILSKIDRVFFYNRLIIEKSM
jgi:S-adenosylmethionine-diacylglycerol 3-amino-3-carboxypropyl transferase